MCVIGLLWVCAAGGSLAETPEPAAHPVAPREAARYIELADDLTLELAACEPQVVDPVAIRFDEHGRLWVVEMRDYPNGPAAGQSPQSRIVVLADADGDGFYERSTVFADGLLFATGLQPWRGGVFVTLAGEIQYLRDDTGDGRADTRETWFRGFAQENPQLRANHPRLALDGWIYVANGLRGGVAENVRLGGEPLELRGMDFRFDPRTGRCETVTGNGQFGLTFDDLGRRFVCSNRQPLDLVVLEKHQLARNPHAAIAAVLQPVMAAGEQSRIFPISRAWTTSNLHAGQFTAACGATIYGGDALPARYDGCGFVCEPTGNLVHVERLTPDGAVLRGEPLFDGREVLASTDEWFRPVNLEVGPDGALYVVDMHRAVIEHPQFMPDELKNRPDLRHGDRQGRIYRLRAKSPDPGPRRVAAAERSAIYRQAFAQSDETLAPLGVDFGSANRWRRETAARRILEGQFEREAVIGPLRTIARHELAGAEAARLQALWLLRHLGESLAGPLAELPDTAPLLLRDGVTVLASLDDQRGTPEQRSAWLKRPRSPYGQLQAVLAIAPVADAYGVEQVAEIVWPLADDRWVRAAAAIADGGAGVLAGRLVRQAQQAPASELTAERRTLLGDLAAQCGAASEPAVLRELIAQFEDDGARMLPRELAYAAVDALLNRAQRRPLSLAEIAGAGWREEPASPLAKLLADATGDAADRQQPVERRLGAIRLVARLDPRQADLAKLALHEPTPALRVAAIQACSGHDHADLWPTLVDQFAGLGPAVRPAVLDALLARPPRIELLLAALADGRLRASDLDAVRQDRLRKHREPAIRAAAEKLLAPSADREQALARFQASLRLTGDEARGREVFRKQCANCHRMGELGVNVGPDISDTRTKSAAQLLTDILQPNRAIDANYLAYGVATRDGQVLSGVLAAETPAAITLRLPEGKTLTLPRDDIEELRSTGVSLMPEGLERDIDEQQMADLLAFLKNWRYLDGRTPLGQ